MTIDSGWVRVMKEECPEAFRSTYPFKGRPKVAYIDGMPLLMISEGRVRSWQDLLVNNFARHIARYSRLGCSAVVLAFDDYGRVPASKAITQANRSKKKAPYEFGEGSQLPPTIPNQYNDKLSNRIFKRRVIDMVCNCVCEHVNVPGTDAYTRTLVLDYTGCPIMFEAVGGKLRFDITQKPTFMVDIQPMGEADIKFLRWADHFGGDMIASSVDGDFIPIALMHHEARSLQNRLHEQMQQERQKNQPESPRRPPLKPLPMHNITIFRIKYKQPPTAAESSARRKLSSASAANTTSKKQKLICGGSSRSMQLSGADAVAQDDPAQKAKSSSAPREYEYVDIPKLCASMQDVFHRLCPGVTRNPLHRHHYMRMLAVLIGLAGTDFSRGLPCVGPSTMWNMLVESSVFSAMLQCYNLSDGLMHVRAARDSLACNIYMQKFASHFKGTGAAAAAACNGASDDEGGGSGKGFKEVLRVLRRSSLSEKTRGGLRSPERVEVTFKNINWLLQYWGCTSPKERMDEGGGEEEGDGTAEDVDVRCANEAAKEQRERWDYSGCYPDPVCKEYGFCRVSASKKSSKKNAGGKGRKREGGCALAGACIQWLDEGGDKEEEEESEMEKSGDESDC